MNSPIVSSTFLLTLLMMTGLVFFIRASVKDRTEELEFISEQPEVSLLEQLEKHFQGRSYRVAAVDAEKHQVKFEGFVSPSWFMAIFLSFLASIGTLCLALVLSILFPDVGNLFLILLLLAPLAGVFYWQKAGRLEQVLLTIESQNQPENNNLQHQVRVTAHRDELIVLREAFHLPLSH
jgi:Flp pilus assembly protein TadB